MKDNWQKMEDAPRDGRYIIALYSNNLFLEPIVVYWNGDVDGIYPWSSRENAYPESRLRAWHEMPKIYETEDSDFVDT